MDVLDNARHITFNGETDTYHNCVVSGNTPLIVPSPKQSSVEIAYTHGTTDTTEIDGVVYYNDLVVEYAIACIIPVLYNGSIRSTDQMNALCSIKSRELETWLYSGPATLYDTGLDFNLPDSECQEVSIDKSAEDTHWVLTVKAKFICPFNLTMSYPTKIRTTRRKNERFIVYNGAASYEFDLMMIGATPMSTMSPKTSSISWAHKNGTLNLTHCKDGLSSGVDSQFYHDRKITYQFEKMFSKFDSNNDEIPANEMNKKLQEFVNKMCCWLFEHSGNSFVTIDGQITYGGTSIMLADSAWLSSDVIPSGGTVNCKILPSARVSNLNVTKNIFSDRWGLSFEIEFSTYPLFADAQLYFPAPQEPTPTPGIVIHPWKHYADFDSSTLEDSDIMMIEKSNSYYSSCDEGIYLTAKETVFTYHGAGLLDSTHRPIGYTVNNNSINFSNFAAPIGGESNFVIEAEHYIHESMSDYDMEHYDMPVLFIIPPPLLFIEVENFTHVFYLNYIMASTLDANGYTNISSGTSLTKFKHRKLVNGEVVETTNSAYGAVVALRRANPSSVECDPFSWKLNVTYNYVGPQGMGQNHGIDLDYFINKEIDIDYRVQHVQRIFGNDILEKYGLYCKDNEYAPETFDVIPMEIVFDYTGEEPTIYYGQKEIITTVNTEPGHKFWHPEHYRERIWDPTSPSGFPGWVKLRIPKVNVENNKYIMCDATKPPESGDIQWL